VGRLTRHGLAAHDRYAIRNGAIIETLLGTGLRVSELCALVVGDLFLDDGAANVLVRRGKGGKAGRARERSTRPVSQGVPDEEGRPRRGSDRLRSGVRLGAPRSPLPVRDPPNLEGRARRGGLDTRWGVHATRHSYAVEVYRKTRDLRLTQRLLRHSSPGITQVYANLLDDDVRRGVAMVWA